MKPEAWIQAYRDGRVQHDWADLTIVDRETGIRGDFKVSAMPAKVDGVIRTGGARAIQQFADAVGGTMLTAKLFAERHRAATVKVPPVVCDINHTTIEQADHLKFQVLARAEGRAGQWLVSGWDKTFVLDELCDTSHGVNDGFFIDATDPYITRVGAQAYYQGIAVYPTDVEGVLAIQERGARHGLDQGDADDSDPPPRALDYSQDVYAMHGDCVVEGSARRSADVLTHPKYCVLTNHSRKPLPFTRQPGVPLLDVHAEPAPQTFAGRFVENTITHATTDEVRAAMGACAPELSKEALALLVAQWAFETDGGRACHNWNLGNAKSRPDGSFGNFTFFTCGENLPLLIAQKMALDPRVMIRKQYVEANGQAAAEVRITPDHPASCFASFDTLAAGAAYYVAMIRRRFASAWPAVVAGDLVQFATALRLAHYYTAPLDLYIRGLRMWYHV